MEENLTGKMEAECAAYFKQYAVFEKILKGFKNKYISFGKFAGTLKLKDIPVKDVEVLEGFFGQNFQPHTVPCHTASCTYGLYSQAAV